jgi:predicted small secreted protein
MNTLWPRLACLAVLFALPACNTMRGVGEDISAMGRYISDSTGTTPSSHSTPTHSGSGY